MKNIILTHFLAKNLPFWLCFFIWTTFSQYSYRNLIGGGVGGDHRKDGLFYLIFPFLSPNCNFGQFFRFAHMILLIFHIETTFFTSYIGRGGGTTGRTACLFECEIFIVYCLFYVFILSPGPMLLFVCTLSGVVPK